MCDKHEIVVEDGVEKIQMNKRDIIRGLAAGTVFLIPPAVSGCSTNPETGRSQLTMGISDSQLTQMAAAAWAEQKKSEPVSNDPRYTRRIADIGGRISTAANRADQPWEYAVFDTDTKNAFVLPGNKVGFYRGMMDFTENDSQLAAIMGHEVGHVSGAHAKERYSQAMLGQIAVAGATMAGAAAMNNRCNDIKKAAEADGRITRQEQINYANCTNSSSRNAQYLYAALGIGYQVGVSLRYSRLHELEADKLGAKYMHNAGYDVMQSVRLWERMAEQGGSRGPEWLSTHPDPSRRAEELHNYIKANGWA